MTFFCLILQFDAIKKYIDNGGNVLVLMGEGGESKFDTNINFLLEDFGIMVNNGKIWCILVVIFLSATLISRN